MQKLGVVYRRKHIIVLRCLIDKKHKKQHQGRTYYYTIVNTKNKTHCHVFENEFKASISICNYASKNMVPDKYPEWMKDRIRRIL